jgi:drug/metabolite transporter (DMT)-like permease
MAAMPASQRAGAKEIGGRPRSTRATNRVRGGRFAGRFPSADIGHSRSVYVVPASAGSWIEIGVVYRLKAELRTRSHVRAIARSGSIHLARCVRVPTFDGSVSSAPNVTSAEHRRAVLMLVLANLFWGLSFPLIKAIVLLLGRLLPAAGTTFVTLYTVAPRFLLALLILVALRPRTFWRISPCELKQGVVLATFAALGMLLQNDGLQFTAASTSAFLTQFYAILIPVWLATRARKNPGWFTWLCCALVLAGAAILGGFNPFAQPGTMRFGRGEVETLLSSLFFMGQILWLEKRVFAGNRPENVTLVMFATEAVIAWTLVVFVAPNLHTVMAPWTSPAWLGMTAMLTVFCTVGAFWLMNAWQPKITATQAGLLYCIEPIFGSGMALFMPAWFSVLAAIDYANERATWSLMVGGGLITLANVLLQLRPPVKELAPQSL